MLVEGGMHCPLAWLAGHGTSAGPDRVLLLQLGELPEEEASTEQTVEQWLQGRCSNSAQQQCTASFADAYYANDIGSELAAMGLAEAAWEARHWCDGERTLVKGGSFAPLVTHLAKGVPVRLSWPVSAVVQHASSARARDAGTHSAPLQGSRDAHVTLVGPAGEVCAVQAAAVRCSANPGSGTQGLQPVVLPQ